MQKIFKSVVFLFALLVSLTALAQDSMSGDMSDEMTTSRLSVTITNLTLGQVFSPPVVINHSADYQLFELGKPALPELIPLAEDGMTQDLLTVAELLPEIYSATVADAPLAPGESVTLTVEVSSEAHYLTVAGMLVSTNDAFFALPGLQIFAGDDMMADDMDDGMGDNTATGDDDMGSDMDSEMSEAPEVLVYDAGSEFNSELCADIPGPPCGNPQVRNTANAEGAVSLHAGIQGSGDLDPMSYNWSNPVATIVIERLP